MGTRDTFVGREAELDEIVGLLAATRLLTLTGAGGAGKTRLALAAAERVGAAAGGPEVLVAPLADLRTGELVLGAVMDAAGVHERPGQPRLDTVLGRLAGREVRLVLDNCEHLAGAAGELAESLLRHSASVRVLATSRVGLEVAGEVTWRAPPLSLPGGDRPADVLGCDAGRLFVERAAGLRPLDDGAAARVARLCRRLRGRRWRSSSPPRARARTRRRRSP